MAKFYIPLSLILLTIYLLPNTLSSKFKIDPASHSYIDQYGRSRIFHGVNVIFKLEPFYPPILDRFDPTNSLCTKDFEDLRRWGFNVIRLHMAWEGAEPVRGVYNATYIEIVRSITREAAKYNISIILDAHQDAASRFFCGEGFPDWVAQRKNFPFPLPFWIRRDKRGYANIDDCLKRHFLWYAVSNDNTNTFKALFEDKNGLATSFGKFWAEVARYFKDEDNVIGYELMNEPGFASLRYYFKSKEQDTKYLQPFYQKIHPIIREVDNDTIILYEATLSNTAIGLTQGPGGPEYNDRQAYGYHMYCPSVNEAGEPVDEKTCEDLDNLLYGKAEDARRLGGGGFLSEIGSLLGTPLGIRELNRITRIADDNLASWAYWQFKFYQDFTTANHPGFVEGLYDENGQLYTPKVKALARSYAYATCGTPIKMNFNPDNAEFFLQYKHKKNCKGFGTEIFLSKEFYYPNGIEVKFDSCEGCQLSLLGNDENYYGVTVSDSVAEGTVINLQVNPKAALDAY